MKLEIYVAYSVDVYNPVQVSCGQMTKGVEAEYMLSLTAHTHIQFFFRRQQRFIVLHLDVSLICWTLSNVDNRIQVKFDLEPEIE